MTTLADSRMDSLSVAKLARVTAECGILVSPV
jgi:hypothetical protein